MIFRRKNRNAVTAAAAPTLATSEAGDPESTEEIFEEIDALTRANQKDRDPQVERRLLRLRHIAGAQLISDPGPGAEHPKPAFEQLPQDSDLPEISPAEMTPELLRAGVLRNGCLLVRGLIDADTAKEIADGIESAFEAREAISSGAAAPSNYYEEFEPDPPFPPISDRPWIVRGGGVLAVDSPRLMYEMLAAFDEAGLSKLIRDYLGERPAISAQKCTLRKAVPDFIDSGAWHQDGAFLGDVRALNVWLSLSHCGDEAPGLDIVPRRVDHIVETGTEGAWVDWSVSQAMAEEAAGEVEIMRPIFEPGDVLLFDDLFLHKTAAEPEMSRPRYAVESWFFGYSAFPESYVPLAA